jgi:LuxR family maltose regulon positive regulatory protein
MARGVYGQAMATLDAFHQLAQQRYLAPVLLAQCAALQARLHLAQGNLPAARRWLDSSGLASTDALSYPLEQAYLTMARIRIAEERINPTESGLSEVLFLLERLRAEAQVSGRMRSVLEVLLLLALALQMRADRTGALATLGQALTLAEPEGYMRLFLDEGPPMLSLLREVQRQGIAAEYIAKLLAAWNGLSTTEAHHTKSLLALLTARERDVLELVLEGASNREIARRLTLSVNTVKKHVLNVCRKLNVQSRAQAIAKVRTLRLL